MRLSHGTPSAPPEIAQQVANNQVHSAEQWDDTALDMAVSDIMVEHQREWDSRWMLLAALALVVILVIGGIFYNLNARSHDRVTDAQRAAAQQAPYTPETIR